MNAAPGGIDARYAWTISGGNGAGVRIIDVEGYWQTTHEDMPVLVHLRRYTDRRFGLAQPRYGSIGGYGWRQKRLRGKRHRLGRDGRIREFWGTVEGERDPQRRERRRLRRSGVDQVAIELL